MFNKIAIALALSTLVACGNKEQPTIPQPVATPVKEVKAEKPLVPLEFCEQVILQQVNGLITASSYPDHPLAELSLQSVAIAAKVTAENDCFARTGLDGTNVEKSTKFCVDNFYRSHGQEAVFACGYALIEQQQ